MKSNRNTIEQRFDLSRSVSYQGHLLLLALVSFIIQLLPIFLSPEYGYFRDELYYIACAKRLAFGYVDHPPFAPFLLRIILAVFGDSLLAIRLLPALAGAITVFITGRITEQLGGGRYAQFIAALAMAISPVFILINGFFSMNPFEGLIWSMCVYIIVILLRHDKPELWFCVGILAGIGLLNKHTFIVYIGSLFLGLLLTPARKYVMDKWIWLGALMTGILLLPNIFWQIQHNFVSLEFYRNATLFKNVDTSPLKIIFDQILLMNPVTFPIWLAGLCYYLFSRSGKPYRLFGWFYVILLATMMLSRSSRPDRMLAAYPVFLAAGSLVIERSLKHHKTRIVQIGVILLLLVFGIGLLPIGLPILPPRTLVSYLQRLGISVEFEKGQSARLPQWYADRFGWEEIASSVAEVYSHLPEDEKSETLFLTGNYGEAGAIEFFGEQYQLPGVISPHNNYHLWGQEHNTAKIYVSVGIPVEPLRNVFNNIEQDGVHTCSYCMDYENNLPIYICRSPKHSIEEIWPEAKSYN